MAVLGASGYTGAECVRLCHLHPNIKITVLTGDKQAGKVGSQQGGGRRRPASRQNGNGSAFESPVSVSATNVDRHRADSQPHCW